MTDESFGKGLVKLLGTSVRRAEELQEKAFMDAIIPDVNLKAKKLEKMRRELSKEEFAWYCVCSATAELAIMYLLDKEALTFLLETTIKALISLAGDEIARMQLEN